MDINQFNFHCGACEKIMVHDKKVTPLNPMVHKLLNLKRYCFGEPIESKTEVTIFTCSICGTRMGDSALDSGGSVDSGD